MDSFLCGMAPINMNVLGYSPEAVDFALLQTNTTKNGAREIRDIVERMLNRNSTYRAFYEFFHIIL